MSEQRRDEPADDEEVTKVGAPDDEGAGRADAESEARRVHHEQKETD